MNSLTEKLDVSDMSAVVSKKGKEHSKEELTRWISVYRAMLHFPAEYFTRSARSELTLKALALDVAVSEDVEQCTILRTFIFRLSGAESFVSLGSGHCHASSDPGRLGRKCRHPPVLPEVIATDLSSRRLGRLRKSDVGNLAGWLSVRLCSHVFPRTVH